MIARVSARFEGFTAHWVNSMRMHPTQVMMFIGKKGRIELTAPFNPNVYGEARLTLAQADGANRVERWPGVNHYVRQVEAFGRSIRDGAPYPWRLEDARGTQAVIDAVFARAATG